ncbi:hypothetical protein NK8_33210 [Caballeronia sp. NK8]|nr:hypothetical protein NK8_33210 [Caballeronia sp. NK8]
MRERKPRTCEALRHRHNACVTIDAHAENVEDIMHHSIESHELTHIDLARFQVVQVSDGTFTVVLWEAPGRDEQASTLTIRLCDPLNPVRRKDVCEHLRAHLAVSRRTKRREAVI